MDNVQQKWCVLVSKYPHIQSEMAIQDDPNDKYLSISRLKYFFSTSDLPIHDILYCLQANNGQFLHMQHHGKVASFPSWILPMLSWFYVQDRYLSCSRTILVSQFHPQEAIDTKKVHGYSQIPNQYPTQGFETSVHCCTFYQNI